MVPILFCNIVYVDFIKDLFEEEWRATQYVLKFVGSVKIVSLEFYVCQDVGDCTLQPTQRYTGVPEPTPAVCA